MPLTFFAVQLLFNIGWMVVFGVLHELLLAAVVHLALVAALLVSSVLYYR